MKVIGLTADRGTYIVTITHSEIEKVMGQYYGKMDALKVGAEVDLGAGYDYTDKIDTACQNMIKAVQSFGSAQNTMMQFAKFAMAQNAEKRPLPDAPEGAKT